MPDFIPAADPQFDAFITVLVPVLMVNPTAYGKTATTVAPLVATRTAWDSAFPANNTAQANAAAAAATKETSRDNLEIEIRALNARVQARTTVTNASKQLALLPVHDDTSTSLPAPATAPLLRVDTSHRFRHTISFRDAANPNKRGKPDGVLGARLLVKIGAPPARRPRRLHLRRPRHCQPLRHGIRPRRRRQNRLLDGLLGQPPPGRRPLLRNRRRHHPGVRPREME